MLNNPLTKAKLQIQMAATVDWGEPFVQACYQLEGDGVLALECYEIIDKVILSINTEHIPNVLRTFLVAKTRWTIWSDWTAIKFIL